jgi:hypothetical protein
VDVLVVEEGLQIRAVAVDVHETEAGAHGIAPVPNLARGVVGHLVLPFNEVAALFAATVEVRTAHQELEPMVVVQM